MLGKDIILKYCSTVETHNPEHLDNALYNEQLILNGKDEGFATCPSTYGLDNYDGLCYEYSVKHENSREKHRLQDEQCKDCWKIALNKDF